MRQVKKIMRNFGILIVGIIFVLFFESAYALAVESENAGFRNLVIRQERFETNGVLVSRPVPLDVKIRDIIVFNNIKSIEDYAHWLERNIKYRKDRNGDDWSAPEETLLRRNGDCEDYAFFNEAVLGRLGYETRVLAVGGLFGNHAICVFQENGYYSWIDNNKLKRSKAQSILEFAKYLFTRYTCFYIYSLDFKTKRWKILYKKSEMVKRDVADIASRGGEER
jgi:hypothetical protein